VTLDALMRLEPAGSRNPSTDGEVVLRFKSIAAENDARRGEDSQFQPTSPRFPPALPVCCSSGVRIPAKMRLRMEIRRTESPGNFFNEAVRS